MNIQSGTRAKTTANALVLIDSIFSCTNEAYVCTAKDLAYTIQRGGNNTPAA